MNSSNLSAARDGYNTHFKTELEKLLPEELSNRDREAFSAVVKASQICCLCTFDMLPNVETEPVEEVSGKEVSGEEEVRITTEQWNFAIENYVAAWYKHITDRVRVFKGDMAMRRVLIRAAHVMTEMKIIAATKLVHTKESSALMLRLLKPDSNLNYVSEYAKLWCVAILGATDSCKELYTLETPNMNVDDNFKLYTLGAMFIRFSQCLMSEMCVMPSPDIRDCENVGEEFWSMAILTAGVRARKQLDNDNFNDVEKRHAERIRTIIYGAQEELITTATTFEMEFVDKSL